MNEQNTHGMTAAKLAEQLNGIEYPASISRDLEAQAKAAGLLIVFGASDDLMEFRGAIHDEIGCCDGGTAYLGAGDLLQNDCDSEDCPHFARAKERAPKIEALWCEEPGYSWTYKTSIPHETFEVVEDGGPYCRGIVFALADLAGA
ncbi:Uncharacterised protein [Ectopseudomonas oleovorans]|uniref:Uncharacterized protein n=1 Tax=Ectopseudomonas oleovorans TaxID=301 RepID=A0A379K5Q1_ECTOL|nr:hypothetical protein [Pseudomonas oleovorans]SUD59752.1 Uncharacterised protein [Pseudomonas oleovorans]